MTADLFLATEAELPGIVEHGPSGACPTVNAKGVDPVKLARLMLILQGTTQRGRSLSLENIALVASGGEDGPWVCRVPDTLTEALAGLGTEALERLAGEWGAVEEWKLHHGTDDSVACLLRDFASLVRACKKSTQVYLWMCA